MTSITLNNTAYDKLRVIVQLWLPAISVFYAAMAAIWGFGYVEQVIGSIAAITVLAGSLLGISRKNFNAEEAISEAAILDAGVYAGALVVDERDPLKDTFILKLDVPFEDLKHLNTLTLRVENSQ